MNAFQLFTINIISLFEGYLFRGFGMSAFLNTKQECLLSNISIS